MIVRCERCETRFKLDESRIPARGARVRCSRCKHAFFVTPPGAAKEELVHQVAAQAARAPAAKPRLPEPSWDLEEGPDATIARRKAGATARAAGGGSEDDNSDWRFEDDVPGLDPGAMRASFDLSGSQTAPSLAAPADPDESSFAELGDPETWDLLAGDAPPAGAPDPLPPLLAEPASDLASPEPRAPAAAPPAVAAAPAEPEPRPTPEPQPRPRVAPSAARTAFAPPALVMPRRIPVASRSSPASAWAAWAGVVALVAAVAWGSLRPVSAPTTVAALAPVSGFEVSEARARIVENAAAGPILVVSGRLRNPGPSARPLGTLLEVQLLDAQGAPLGGGAAAAPAGPALPEARVREDAPEQLVAAQQVAAATLASASVAAGAELDFSAVFAPAPREASRFALTATGPAR